MRSDLQLGHARGAGLVDVLDRVLDKGLVIAGDIKVSLAEVELLTIRIRLLVCSLDKAEAMGLDWWKHDRYLSPGANQSHEVERLKEQVKLLEAELAAVKKRPTRSRRLTAPRSRRR